MGLGMLLLVAMTWLALLAWAAARTTRLEPARATTPTELALLQRRLAALAGAGAPLVLHAQDATRTEVELMVDVSGERSHRVVLRAEPGARCVRVLEQLAAAAAAPLGHEAPMRRPGDPLVAASRPPVQRVWGRVRQTTIVDAGALAAWPLRVQGAEVQGADLRPSGWDAADAEARGRMGVALLAGVVLASGWAWQPQLIGGASRVR